MTKQTLIFIGIIVLAIPLFFGLVYLAHYIQNSPVTPPNNTICVYPAVQNEETCTVNTSTTTSPLIPITWNPTLINSRNVQIAIIKKVTDNPVSYDLIELLATSTPNTGDAGIIQLSNDEEIEVGCIDEYKIDRAKPCTAIYITP